MQTCKQIFYFLLLISISCSTDSDSPDSNPLTEILQGSLGKATYFNRDQVSDDLILLNDAQQNRAYLMDRNAELIHEWPLDGKRLGNDVFLMNNGKVLAMLESEDPKIKLGGFGGIIQILDKNGNVEWNFEYSTEDYILHHDAEMLPNGNILTQIWERKTKEEAIAAGYAFNSEVFPDGLIEINPLTKEIVWEWHVWDHLIQDFDSTKDNFGSIQDNPRLINLNYVSRDDGDITHANGIAYDATNDLIYLSVNFFNEVWVIDHSTTTLEAATNNGGNMGHGGNLIYRFGNPLAYGNPKGTTLFDHNHRPNLLKGEYNGHMLIFSNGFTSGQSTVYELKLPQQFLLESNQDNEPEVLWSFTDKALFSPKVSGAERLSNGNTLITEGDFGIWEVNQNGTLVWQFQQKGFFWRSYPYSRSSEAVKNLELN